MSAAPIQPLTEMVAAKLKTILEKHLMYEHPGDLGSYRIDGDIDLIQIARAALEACHAAEMHELLTQIAIYPDANSISDVHYVVRKQARELLAKIGGKL